MKEHKDSVYIVVNQLQRFFDLNAIRHRMAFDA
jgi:hypothetical protein